MALWELDECSNELKFYWRHFQQKSNFSALLETHLIFFLIAKFDPLLCA